MRPTRPFARLAAAWLAFLVIVGAQAATGGDSPPRAAAWGEIRAMTASDQRFRSQLQGMAQQGQAGSAEFKALAEAQLRIDRENMARLDELLRAHGWPRGEGAAEVGAAAALVIQHADLADQKRWLPDIQEAAKHGDLSPISMALLVDRVLMREGQAQRYGTQVVRDSSGKAYIHPIADAAHLNERRGALGLEGIASYAARKGASYEPLQAGPIKLPPGLCPDMPKPSVPNMPDGDYHAVARFWLRGDGRIEDLRVQGAHRLVPIIERNLRSFRCLATGDDREIEMDFRVLIS